jgi:hypothetical protein
MTPQHSKSLLIALKDNIEKFEKEFGEIKSLNKQETKDFGFKIGDEKTDRK